MPAYGGFHQHSYHRGAHNRPQQRYGHWAQQKTTAYGAQWQQQPRSAPRPEGVGAGLTNLGNTCFMNSVLQCVVHTPSLNKYFLEGRHSAKCSKNKGFCIGCKVEELVKTTFKQNSGAFAPHGIAHNLHQLSRSLRQGRQEDAHEFLRYLLEHLTQVFLPLQKYPQDRGRYTFLQWWFQGTLQSQIQCTRCGGESNTLDAFLDLSLELAAAPNGTGGGGGGGVVPTVTRAMELFTHTEILDGANKYKCERCACLVPARKQFTLQFAPKHLNVHLKRFRYGGGGGAPGGLGGGKICQHVAFEAEWDVTRFTTAHAKEQAGGPPAPKMRYRLYAVLVHEGSSTASGHYYCYVRPALSANGNGAAAAGGWHLLNDSHVRPVGESEVLQAKAYLLFYERLVVPGGGGAPSGTGAAAAAAAAAAGPPPAGAFGPAPPPADSRQPSAELGSDAPPAAGFIGPSIGPSPAPPPAAEKPKKPAAPMLPRAVLQRGAGAAAGAAADGADAGPESPLRAVAAAQPDVASLLDALEPTPTPAARTTPATAAGAAADGGASSADGGEPTPTPSPTRKRQRDDEGGGGGGGAGAAAAAVVAADDEMSDDDAPLEEDEPLGFRQLEWPYTKGLGEWLTSSERALPLTPLDCPAFLQGIIDRSGSAMELALSRAWTPNAEQLADELLAPTAAAGELPSEAELVKRLSSHSSGGVLKALKDSDMSVDVSDFLDELQIEACRIIDASEAPPPAADAADAAADADAPADAAAAPPPAAVAVPGDSDDDDERCLQLEQMLADHAAGAVAKSPHLAALAAAAPNLPKL